MPTKAGMKLSTPLIRSYGRWLLEDIGRTRSTVHCYVDSVEFFAASHPAAGTLSASRVTSARSTPNENRWITDDELQWSSVALYDLEGFVRAPMFSTGLAPSKSTRRRRAYALKAFFDFLEDHAVVAVSAAAKLRGPGVQIGKPKPIPDDVWLAIWDQDMSMDDRVLLALGYYLGLRRHEMVSIGPHHFNLGTRRVANFPRKGGKTNEVVYGMNLDIIAEKLPHLGVRLDEFEEALCKIVAVRVGEPRLLALTEHVEVSEADSTINRRMTALAARHGVHVTPHQMRHSFATNLLRAGVPAIVVADQMAHASLETTRGYLDTTQWYETREGQCA